MKPSLRFVCPKCGYRFPFFAVYTRSRIRSALLSAPWFRCTECDCLSRQQIAWGYALWAWPLALLTAGSIIALFRNASPLLDLQRGHPCLCGALAGLCLGSVFFLVRLGLRLTPVFDAPKAADRAKRMSWFLAITLLVFLVGFGLVTHRWVSGIVALAVGIAVWSVFYFRAKRVNKGSVEQTTEDDFVAHVESAASGAHEE